MRYFKWSLLIFVVIFTFEGDVILFVFLINNILIATLPIPCYIRVNSIENKQFKPFLKWQIVTFLLIIQRLVNVTESASVYKKLIHLDKAGIQQVSRIEEMNTFSREGLKNTTLGLLTTDRFCVRLGI